MRIAYCDLEQAESRTVGAIIYRLFGDDTYLNVQECVTGEHEVLTPLGWVPITNQPNQIACWSPTDQTINFMEVIKWHTHTADTTLSIEGRNFNIRCTPQHKMPYWSSRKPQRIQHEPAEKLVQRYSRRLPLTGFYKQGSASISPEYAKFCAAFQADGYINKNKQIEFSFGKQRKIERMHKILNQLDFQYSINTFPAYREGELPQTRFYVKCPEKDIPPKAAGLYLLEWKLPSLISYIEEHEFWDGHRENASGYRMVSANYKHLEWIATIAHLCGYAATINAHKQDYYILTIRSWNTTVTEKTAYRMETHKDPIQVYCPTVPSGFFIFRYKGQIAVTGNSGDPHSLVCSMAWRNLPWPADFRLELLPSMPNRKFPPDLMAAARAVANTEYYRGKSYRDMAKTLSHGCLTADHEVLTPTGWVFISEKPPVIMQSDGQLVQVSNWIDKEYSGQFIHWEGQSLSTTITADHRVYYKIDETGVKEAPAYAVPKTANIMLSGEHYEGGGQLEPHPELLAAYHCDGRVSGKKVAFHLKKQRKIERLEDLCLKSAIAFGASSYDRYTASFIPSFSAPSWDMLAWAKPVLQRYMWELPYWDGHFAKTSTALFSKSPDWIEKWQTFNRLLGYGGNVQKTKISGFGTTMYQLQVNNRKWANRKSFTVDEIFEGTARVFCPTVPSHAFYVRRNGKIHVTGNSNYYGQPATMAKHTHTEVKIIATFQTGYFGAFPSIRRWHNWVKLQLETTATITTLLGRKRKFWGRPDDNATLREMIAFEPQSVATGDYMNAGMLALWQQNLPLYLHKQIHDALAFSFDRRDEEWLIPAVCETLSWPITLTAHPDQLTTLQKLVRRSQQEERDLAKLLALPQREFRIPVEANVGWNLSKATPRNPNGLIKWKPSVPDTRSRTPTVALTPMERIRLGLCDFTGIV